METTEETETGNKRGLVVYGVQNGDLAYYPQGAI